MIFTNHKAGDFAFELDGDTFNSYTLVQIVKIFKDGGCLVSDVGATSVSIRNSNIIKLLPIHKLISDCDKLSRSLAKANEVIIHLIRSNDALAEALAEARNVIDKHHSEQLSKRQ